MLSIRVPAIGDSHKRSRSRPRFGIMCRMSRRWARTSAGLRVPRREILRGGLATFATAMMSKLLPGCDSNGSGDAGVDARAPLPDAFRPPDAGHPGFPVRDIPAPPSLRSLIADIGPLGDADANGVRLPAGFTSRVIGRGGDLVEGTSYMWHRAPDGGAAYGTEDGGWIYACNCELPIVGGAGAVRFDSSGAIVDAYRILDRTSGNCAGGRTPWHTWLSGEENEEGLVWECDPWGEVDAVARPAMGIFVHEAVAIDHDRGHAYLTEDRPTGCFYRFVPDELTKDGFLVLGSGRLEVAAVADDGTVSWLEVPDPRREIVGGPPTRSQVPDATSFDGGEGIWYHEGTIYFSTKGDGRIWQFEVGDSMLSVLYDAKALGDPMLTGVDNITVSCCGDVLVAEDGGTMELIAIQPDGELKPLIQLVGQDESEITGPAFDPSGTRLYFSSQRSPDGGTTYEVTGPFHEPD
jgi:uncharacterized protein